MPKSNSEISPKFDMRAYTKNGLQYKMTSKLGALYFLFLGQYKALIP